MRNVGIVVTRPLILPLIIVSVSYACIIIGHRVLTTDCVPVKLIQLVWRHLLLAANQRCQGLLHVLAQVEGCSCVERGVIGRACAATLKLVLHLILIADPIVARVVPAHGVWLVARGSLLVDVLLHLVVAVRPGVIRPIVPVILVVARLTILIVLMA